MPVSKNGKLYVTKAQIGRANEASALEYAQSHGYNLTRDGNSYHLREHDSMVFTQDGRWFWNSRGYAGRALQFLMRYERMSLPDAVSVLAGDTNQSNKIPLPESSPPTKNTATQKPFELPPRADSFKRLFAYLCYTRGLDSDIVHALVKGNRLYQSEHGNAVFLGLDATGTPRSGFQRGLNTYGEKPFKRDVARSEKQYAFCLPGRMGVETVAVFEASIDAVSHASAAKLLGEDYQDRDRIALGGVSSAPLLHYLKDYPATKRIVLALDNDEAGQTATVRIMAELRDSGFALDSIRSEIPPQGKDWNDSLLWLRHQIEEMRATPPVREGDLVYLNNAPYRIKSVSSRSVVWYDPDYPIAPRCTTAVEFQAMLRADERNNSFFPDMERGDELEL